MAAWRRAIELWLTDADTAKLRAMAQSRTEPASRVERARILLAYREDPSFFAVGQGLGLHHQTVQRCVERAVAEGAMAALDDRVRPGREPIITVEAKAWLTDLACHKAKDFGYRHELWTTRSVARTAPMRFVAAAAAPSAIFTRIPTAVHNPSRSLWSSPNIGRMIPNALPVAPRHARHFPTASTRPCNMVPESRPS